MSIHLHFPQNQRWWFCKWIHYFDRFPGIGSFDVLFSNVLVWIPNVSMWNRSFSMDIKCVFWNAFPSYAELYFWIWCHKRCTLSFYHCFAWYSIALSQNALVVDYFVNSIAFSVTVRISHLDACFENVFCNSLDCFWQKWAFCKWSTAQRWTHDGLCSAVLQVFEF